MIAVDWNELAEALYSSAVEASFDVASVHATFIKELNDKLGVRPESVHLIGHSLGAHIFGLTGESHVLSGNRAFNVSSNSLFGLQNKQAKQD